jgi:hypothetical protein
MIENKSDSNANEAQRVGGTLIKLLEPIPNKKMDNNTKKNLILTNCSIFIDNLKYIEDELNKINKETMRFKNSGEIREYRK